ncbi:MAG: hypothetical protein ACREQ5_08340, partial [Candidatus Dormibacteria bacterium]
MALNFNIPGQGNLPQLPGTPQNIQAGPVVPTMTSAIGSGASVLDNGGYDLNVMRYPSEIATVDVPSYIVFNIYVPTTSQYVKTNADSDQTIQSASQNNLDYLHKLKGKPLNGGGNLPGAAVLASLAGGSSFLSTFGATQDLSSAVGAGAGSAVVEGAIASSVNAFSADTIQLKPQLKKIAQSIQLYMPDTVLMQFDHAYDTDKGLTGALGQLGQFAALGKDITTALKGIGGAIKNAYHTGSTKGLAKAVGAVVKNAAESPIGREYVGGLAESTGLVGPGFTQLALR